MNLILTPYSRRICMTCLAVKSKKVSLPLMGNNDLALSRPMPVPRPPLSLSTTVCDKSAGLGVTVNASARSKSGTGEISPSGIIPVEPDSRELNVDSKAEIAEGAMPSASILACWSSSLEYINK